MNYFLILITILSVIVFGVYVPLAYASNVVDPIINTFFTPVVNFVINTTTVVFETVVATVSAGLTAVCGINQCGMAGILNPFVNDLNCRNLIGANPALPGQLKSCGVGPVSGSPTSPTFSASTTPLTTFSYTNALPTCTSITLTGIDASGNNYSVVRDGVIVANLPASQTSYTDTNLAPHTSYEYRIRIINAPGASPPGVIRPAELSLVIGRPRDLAIGAPLPSGPGSSGRVAPNGASESAPIVAYTKCLPQCGFGVLSSSVPKFGTTELSWKCLYNDMAIDGGSCAISDLFGILRQNVDSTRGSLTVKITDNNQYILACANKDGAISIPQSVSALTPGIKEVRP